MYLGKIVETGSTRAIFDDPSHPSTQKLLDSVPRATVDERVREIEPIAGDVPSPRNPPDGCRFHTRCPHARTACTEEPPMYDIEAEHRSACYRVDETHEYWTRDELTERDTATHRTD